MNNYNKYYKNIVFLIEIKNPLMKFLLTWKIVCM